MQVAQSADPFEENNGRPADDPFDPFDEPDANDVGGDAASSTEQAEPPAAQFDPFEEPPVDSAPAQTTAAPEAGSLDNGNEDYLDESILDLFDEPMPEQEDEVEPEPEQPEQVQPKPEQPTQPEEAPTPSEQEQLPEPLDGQFQTPLPEVDEPPGSELTVPEATPPRRPDALDSSNLGIGDDLPPGFTDGEFEQLEREQIERERIAKDQECEELLRDVKADRIDSISLDISLKGVAGKHYPFSCGLGDEAFQGRSWSQVTYLWKASGLCYKPLYFEQVQLERYGHSWGPYVQPIVSGAHFFATFPVLPYKMGIQTPNECVYPLGYYRPGNCAPYMIDAVPFTWRAALFEAGAWVGGAAAIP